MHSQCYRTARGVIADRQKQILDCQCKKKNEIGQKSFYIQVNDKEW